MKESYTIDDGRIVISHGAGRGGSLSERVPLFAENVLERFSKNKTYIDMRVAGEKLQGRASFETRIVIGVAVVVFVVVSIINIQSSMNAAGAFTINEIGIIFNFLTTMFLASLVMLVISFTRPEEIPNDDIIQLATESDVRVALRSYYEEFVVVAVDEFSNSKTANKPEISEFKIETVGDLGKGFGNRQIKLSGRCDSQDKFYKVEVLLNFNPIYHNLKVIKFSVE